MVQGGGGQRLCSKRRRRSASLENDGQDFGSDQARIPRAVHLSHSSSADHALDLVGQASFQEKVSLARHYMCLRRDGKDRRAAQDKE